MGWLWVGLGGSLGAVLRYWVGKWTAKNTSSAFPVGTFVVNTTGSLLLGLVTRYVGILLPHAALGATLFLGTGLCGAYTTFSTFSYETVTLFQRGRTSVSILYLCATLTVGLAAAGVGLYGLPMLSSGLPMLSSALAPG